jgi:hypothetical protein
VPNALAKAVEDDRASVQRIEHFAEPHVLRLRQLLGETFDAHRHRLDLTGQRGVLGAEVVAVGTQDLVFASERGNRLRYGSALQATWSRAPGEVHGRLKPILVAKAGEA